MTRTCIFAVVFDVLSSRNYVKAKGDGKNLFI